MSCRWCACVLLLSFSFASASEEPNIAATKASVRSSLPVTTTSAMARTSFEEAMRNYEQLRITSTLGLLRNATRLDPHFAQAFIMIASLSTDPVEQGSARKQALQYAATTTFAEQLLIHWIADAQENDFVPAIAAMNDLLEKYPQDQRVAFLSGRWLIEQQRYAQAVTVIEHAVALHPQYPAALNDLGYAYAYSGDFDKALAAMEKYLALEPDEPNPHDSYGEILRMAGKFDAAVQQYRECIHIDPNFGSELGLADTYALMGKEQEARDEYFRAAVFAASQADRVAYELQSATTWLREENHPQAGKALEEVARDAHASGLGRLEAEAHRIAAMDEKDPKTALKQLQSAEGVLQEAHDLSKKDRDEEKASILRVKVMRLVALPDLASADDVVKQLEIMAGNSRSQVIQTSYHGAAGALLIAEGKYDQAISQLEENARDPLSMRLLWQAYVHTGAKQQAQDLASHLVSLNDPTAEQALVVPQFRAELVGQKQP
jgi:tetratricopeptide (TPR) repeat protein